MTLQDAIEKVLKDNNRPLSAKVIASFINTQGYYIRADNQPLQGNQILARVKNYPTLFQNINGYIILVQNESWKNLLTSYWYLVNFLTEVYVTPDIKFLASVLFFYKRLIDINSREEPRYLSFFEEPLKISLKNIFPQHLHNSLDDMVELGQDFFQRLKFLPNYRFLPDGIFDECARLLSQLNNNKKNEIWSVISNIKTDKLDDREFGNIFDYFITIDSSDSYKLPISNTPYSLRELMVGILKPVNGFSIYDPVAGTGGLLIDAILYADNKSITIGGSEINRRLAQLGNMNLIMHGIFNVQIEAKNCFEELNNARSFDYIIADLPVNGVANSLEYFRLYRQYNLEPQKSGAGFGSMVLLVLSKLTDQGKAVLTVSDGFLVKKGKEKEIRDLLISLDLVESIVSLPYGTLRPYTDAKASLLILNKRKPNHLIRRIKFIAARATSQDSKTLTLNSEEIIKAYEGVEEISKDAQVVNLSDLRTDTNLSADAYDVEYVLGNLMLKEGSGKMLSELVEIKAGIQPDKSDISNDGAIPFVKIENLSRDILDLNWVIDINSKIHLQPKYLRSVIDKDCILLARIGESLKPVIFRPTDETPQVIPHRSVYALIPLNTSSGIDIEYLYYQLHTSFVLEQIDKKRLGAVMPYISIASLTQIVIPYMKLDAQLSFVESQKANLIAEERKRIEEKFKALGYKDEVEQTESDIVRTLVHQLRPTLLNIDLEVKKIKRIINENNIELLKENIPKIETDDSDLELSEHIGEVHNYSLIEIVEKLKSDTVRLSEVLTIVNKVMSFKLAVKDFENVELSTFLSNYLASKEIEIDNKFKVEVVGENFNVEINKASVKELIDQLLLNAIEHGFNNYKSSTSKRLVQFSLRRNKDRQVAVIDYFNNGDSFNLEKDDYIKAFHKGQKSKGSGIGGNYIFRIIQAHQGKMILKQGLKNGFAITFEMPLKQTKEYE